MSVVLKIIAGLLIIGGLWIWLSGRSIHGQTQRAVVPSASLSASAGLALTPDSEAFDEEGSIVIDTSQGEPGTPYILYTVYTDQGKPAIRTKRLIFTNQDACGESNLPCASGQPGAPVNQDEKVRVVGIEKDEGVIVEHLERLSL